MFIIKPSPKQTVKQSANKGSNHNVLSAVRLFFKNKMDVWLTKRIPASGHHRLTSRNIFIFPTPFGFAYIGLVVLLLVLATNYQNNLIMLLSYILASLFITVMMHSFYNFSNLSFDVQQKQVGLAGSNITFPLIITNKKLHFDLNFRLDSTSDKKSDTFYDNKITQCSPGQTMVNLTYLNDKRGQYSLGRVTIFSEYSFGLFKSWTHLDFGLSALIYPKPLSISLSQQQLSGHDDESVITSYQSSDQAGMDEFNELKSFIPGESKARTAWKQLARGQGHYSKHYEESQSTLLCLKLVNMPTTDLETQLSYLSFLVNELTRNQQTFSLQLHRDKEAVGYNSGVAHQQACLTALALHHV